MEPKILPPSMRPPKRYIVYEIISDTPVIYGEFMSAVWTSVMDLLGELGGSEAGIWFIHNSYNTERQRGILKCRHNNVEKVRASLSLISVVSESRCVVRILGVTGTIKSANAKYMGE